MWEASSLQQYINQIGIGAWKVAVIAANEVVRTTQVGSCFSDFQKTKWQKMADSTLTTPTLPTLKLKLKTAPLASQSTQPAQLEHQQQQEIHEQSTQHHHHHHQSKQHSQTPTPTQHHAPPKLILKAPAHNPDVTQPELNKRKQNDSPLAPVSSSSKKRKQPDFEIPATELKGVLTRLTMAVRHYSAEDGRNLAALFNALPNSQIYPDYYVLIQHPTALNIMQQKINGGKYNTIADLKAEMRLMIENAKTYNAPGSLIYEDAETLWEVFNAEVAKVRAQYTTAAVESSSSSLFHHHHSTTPRVKLTTNSSKPSHTATPTTSYETHPENYILSRDGKPIHKREIDVLFRAIQDNNVKGFERAILQLRIPPDTMGRANVDVGDGVEFEWAPLHAVSFFGRAKMLDILVGQKADMEIRDTFNESTPLMWAAYAGKVNTARRLMRNNRPDRYAKNKLGQTAMDMAFEPENPEWRGLLNNETPVAMVDKSGANVQVLDSSRRDRERRVPKLPPAQSADSPATPSVQKITYVGEVSVPETRASNHPRSSQVKDTTPMVRPTMPVDLNKVPKWAKLPNTKDTNQLFLAAGSKEMAILLEAPPIKDIEIPLPMENLVINVAPGLKTMRANAVTIPHKISTIPIRFYLANGNRGVYYSIQVWQNRTPLVPVLLNGGTETSEDGEPTVVEVRAALWEGVNVFDVIVFLCRKAELKGAAAKEKEAAAAAAAAAQKDSSGAEGGAGGTATTSAAAAAGESEKPPDEFVGIQKKGHHAFQKAMLIVSRV
ncbi:hypothetical protein HK100_010252 [Physocladia obscura]|uniref:Bromo domain-containing protein n=1 Tax=Physocladia obscura TaxID=109957 RepID=A0AAD5TBM4_9FUNG|nr:hypothetical protein HK100_010252 [Physocladia obscura]